MCQPGCKMSKCCPEAPGPSRPKEPHERRSGNQKVPVWIPRWPEECQSGPQVLTGYLRCPQSPCHLSQGLSSPLLPLLPVYTWISQGSQGDFVKTETGTRPFSALIQPRAVHHTLGLPPAPWLLPSPPVSTHTGLVLDCAQVAALLGPLPGRFPVPSPASPGWPHLVMQVCHEPCGCHPEVRSAFFLAHTTWVLFQGDGQSLLQPLGGEAGSV